MQHKHQLQKSGIRLGHSEDRAVQTEEREETGERLFQNSRITVERQSGERLSGKQLSVQQQKQESIVLKLQKELKMA